MKASDQLTMRWRYVLAGVIGVGIATTLASNMDSDANEFLREFPECCKFVAANSGDYGPQLSVWDRIRGVRTVEVSYDKSYAADDGAQKSAPTTAKVAVTSCGIGRPFR